MYDYADEELVAIKVIRSKGQVTLVSYDDSGRARRKLIPRDAVIEDEADKFYASEESLDMGIPYGADWENRLRDSFVITGAQISEQLEVLGIWTKEDYENNPQLVQQAVLGAARGILTDLLSIVRTIPN